MKKFIFLLSFLTFGCVLSCRNIQSEYTDGYLDNGQYLGETEIEDGTHSATVDYYNPKTGYFETYILDVQVKNGKVNQINFPIGGHLDKDHITAEELDENGSALVDGQQGKRYHVTIDN